MKEHRFQAVQDHRNEKRRIIQLISDTLGDYPQDLDTTDQLIQSFVVDYAKTLKRY